MTKPEMEAFGAELIEALRAAGAKEIVMRLMMAGYAIGCAVADRPAPIDVGDFLPTALKLLSDPPTFVKPPPVQN